MKLTETEIQRLKTLESRLAYQLIEIEGKIKWYCYDNPDKAFSVFETLYGQYYDLQKNWSRQTHWELIDFSESLGNDLQQLSLMLYGEDFVDADFKQFGIYRSQAEYLRRLNALLKIESEVFEFILCDLEISKMNTEVFLTVIVDYDGTFVVASNTDFQKALKGVQGYMTDSGEEWIKDSKHPNKWFVSGSRDYIMIERSTLCN